jgi:four helix bundle protein
VAGYWLLTAAQQRKCNNMKARSYKDLIAWQKSMDLVVWIYQIMKAFPPGEVYGLTSQLRRAAISIPSNIAEGQGRNSVKEFQHFLSISYGSLQETETQIMIACRLQFIDASQEKEAIDRCSEVGRLINGLANSLRSSS